MYTLKRQQIIKATLEEAWSFMEDPRNLNAITPEELDFSIISDVPSKMYNGLIIEYRIKIPIFGTWQWIAELKHIREKHSFVDEQRLGPYRFWYHYHEIIDTGSGLQATDQVFYQPPFGLLGRLLHFFFIRKQLEHIFDYRQKKFEELLG